MNWPLFRHRDDPGPRVDHRDRRDARRDLPPDAAESVVLPGGGRRSLFLVSGAELPDPRPALDRPAIGMLTPLTWWIEGIPAVAVPRVESPRSAGPGRCSRDADRGGRPNAAQIVLALLVAGSVTTLLSIAVFGASDRRAKDRGCRQPGILIVARRGAGRRRS